MKHPPPPLCPELSRWRSAVARVLVVLFGFGASAGINAAAPIAIVAPGKFAGQEGDSGDVYPFGQNYPVRYQQVYAASEFLAINPTGGWVTRIGFRHDGYLPYTFREDIVSLLVKCSTTAKAPDGLSLVFAENIGADETVVFGPAPLSMNSDRLFMGSILEGNPWDPNPWTSGTAITLSTPFFYHPQQGNLLLDIKSFSGTTTSGNGSLDVTSVVGDSVSSVYGNDEYSGSGIKGTWGYITRFEIIPAPPRPTLAIERSGQATLLRWPTNAAGFVLESISTLGAPNQWATVTNAPAVADTNYCVTNTLSAPSQFYRLRYVVSP